MFLNVFNERVNNFFNFLVITNPGYNEQIILVPCSLLKPSWTAYIFWWATFGYIYFQFVFYLKASKSLKTIQNMVPGFEPTTSWSWAICLNHWTKATRNQKQAFFMLCIDLAYHHQTCQTWLLQLLQFRQVQNYWCTGCARWIRTNNFFSLTLHNFFNLKKQKKMFLI